MGSSARDVENRITAASQRIEQKNQSNGGNRRNIRGTQSRIDRDKEQDAIYAERNKIVGVEEFDEIEGPLAKLEKSIRDDGAKTLTFPGNLGSDSNFAGRYAMRILIYRQEKSPQTELGIVSQDSSPFDRAKKATQQGRINYKSFGLSSEITGTESDELIGALATAGFATSVGAFNLIKAKTIGKGLANGLSGGVVSSVASAAVSVAQIGAAVAATKGLEGNPNTLVDPQAYIHLYMPETLNFVDRHDYDAVSVTDALGLQGLVAQGNSTELLARIGERASVFGVNLLGQNFTELALFNSGVALNPQLELLYRKTNNREFIFNFRLSPKNPTDAITIESIIRTLRYHAAPRFRAGSNASSRYIIPPSQFEIEFICLDENGVYFNDRLPRIASCVLSGVDVNYAPAGQFSAFFGDFPVETQLQLTFTETVILTKQDISIGY